MASKREWEVIGMGHVVPERRPTPLTYLATPYSHEDPAEMSARAALAARVAAAMKARGETVYAPVVYGHMLAIYGAAGRGIEDWAAECRAWIERSTEMAVLDLDASRESRGVRHDIEVARELGIPIRFVDLAGMTVRTPGWAAEARAENAGFKKCAKD